MNRLQFFLNRQSGLVNDQSYDFALRRLCVAKEDSWRGIAPSHYSSDFNPEPPIFAAKFANIDGYRHILAIANEDGKIALQDVTLRNYELQERALAAPQCHFNAVFDLEWAPNEMRFVSASGDHTARLWQVQPTGDLSSIRIFCGHSRSVKTATFRKNDGSVFATGGRDGAIIIWDTRAILNTNQTPRADNCIYSGHVGGPGTPVTQRRRTRTPKNGINGTSSSITGLAFQDGNTLVSCGAGDGIIKVWDLRRNYTTYKREPLPKFSLPYAGSSTFKGFTNLVVDSAGARLFANCMDNTIYCYNLYSQSPKPIARYRGLANSTFYIKSCLSPDNKYLLSGSSDEKAYIWNLDYPDEPLVSLNGHTVEVTCVAWGSTHDCPIVTCSDDARHKVWRIGREDLDELDLIDNYRGHAKYVRQYHSKQLISARADKVFEIHSTPRSLGRWVDQNERTPTMLHHSRWSDVFPRTPGTRDKSTTKKRSLLDMLGSSSHEDALEQSSSSSKRMRTVETRGRRLFGPPTATVTSAKVNSASEALRALDLQLTAISEERPTTTSNIPPHSQLNRENVPNLLSPSSPLPLSERTNLTSNAHVPPTATNESPTSSNRQEAVSSVTGIVDSPSTSNLRQPFSSVIFSPTSNLPNFVLNGEAPHLGAMSPKRAVREKVDWLTKIRKQKLASRQTSLAEKINESASEDSNGSTTSNPNIAEILERPPRPRFTPLRRLSQTVQSSGPISPSISQARTPTTTRRNSETTILRFFSIQAQHRTDIIQIAEDAHMEQSETESESEPEPEPEPAPEPETLMPATAMRRRSTTCAEPKLLYGVYN